MAAPTAQARTAAHVMYHAHVGHHVDHGGALAHHLDPLTDSVQDVREHISKMKQVRRRAWINQADQSDGYSAMLRS